MIVFDKNEIKEALTVDNTFELLVDFGGDPEYSSFGILCSTICHNPPGEGSRKLYFYDNSNLFRCYTGCDSYFDAFLQGKEIPKNDLHVQEVTVDYKTWNKDREYLHSMEYEIMDAMVRDLMASPSFIGILQ